jgi:L-ectoine synthase
MRFIRKKDLLHTSRHVHNDTYETVRFLLADDGMGVTITDILLEPGVPATYGYEQHVEMAYCIAGEAVVVDLSTNRKEQIEAGTLWIAEPGSRFLFEASTPTRLICIFIPPFTGHETGFAGDQ